MIQNVITKITDTTNKIEMGLALLGKSLLNENISPETYLLFRKVTCLFAYNKGVTETLCEKMLSILNASELFKNENINDELNLINKINFDTGEN